MKFFRVFVSTTKSGHRSEVFEYDAQEKPKAYHYTTDNGRKRIIDKSKLMKVDSIFNNDIQQISYHTYCLDGQQDEAIKMLKEAVLTRYDHIKKSFDSLTNSIQSIKSTDGK